MRRSKVGKLLRLAGPGFVRHRGIDRERHDVGAARARFVRQLHGVAKCLRNRRARGAEARERADRIDVEERGGFARLRLEQFERTKKIPRCLDAADTACKLHGGVVEIDAGQRRGHIGCARDCDPSLAGGRDLQHHARGAAFELLQDHRVRGAGVRRHDALVDVPAEAHGPRLHPAREQSRARHRRLSSGKRIGACVERVYLQPVGGARNKLAVEVGAVERLFDEFTPSLVIWRLEAAGERDRRA